VTCRSVTTPFSSAFSASSAVARFLRAFQYAFSSRKYWKTPGKSPVFAFKGKEVIVSLARSYDAKMTTFRSQKAHKTSKMDSPGPPLRSPRPLRFHVHLRPSAAHLPNTFQCAALSAHPPLRSLRLCERRSWLPSLRPQRSPRLPPIRAFCTSRELQPISLCPNVLRQFPSPTKGPERPGFSPLSIFWLFPKYCGLGYRAIVATPTGAGG